MDCPKSSNQHNFSAAVQCFDKALKQNANNATAYYYEAISYQQLNNMVKARQLYKLICERYPNSQEARLAMGVLQQLNPSYLSQNKSPTSSISSTSSLLSASAQSNSPSTAEMKALPNEAKVSFTRGTGGHLYVNATISGHPIRMIFDTGASITAMGKNHLDALGISVPKGGQTMSASGASGKAVKATIATIPITLGTITRNVSVAVLDNLPTDPLLGENFFNAFEYNIDNQGGFIDFVKKGYSGSTPYDTTEVPFTNMGNNILIQVEINGKKCQMCFDTGASINTMPLFLAASLGIPIPQDAPTVRVQGVDGASMAYMVYANTIKVGSILKTNVPILIQPAGGMLPLLGQAFFKNTRFTIDNNKHVIRFWH